MIAAIVPAAGQSRRMGRPKLTLPVSGGGLVIDRVVSALIGGGAGLVVVVTPPLDEPGAAELAERASAAGASVLTLPEATPDMRTTVERGLDVLEQSPPLPSGVLVCPADSVGLTPRLVGSVVSRMREEPGAIVLPAFDGRRGHPLGLPWGLALAIRSLPPDVGINALRERFADRVVLLDVDEPGTTSDLDTPEDYTRWRPA